MPKHIVLCSDGTGNSGGKGNNTNVWRIYQSVDLNGFKTGQHGVEQLAFYDDGVGTDQLKLLKMLGGAVGLGLSRNVRHLYSRLVKNYEPGDHVYVFGFSRGAFTVRTLAGFITSCGILDRSHCPDDKTLERLVKTGYRAYRRKYAARLTRLWYKIEEVFGVKRPTIEEFRHAYGVQVEREQYGDYEFVEGDFVEERIVPVRFMGVWDSVDAVGFPVDEIADLWNENLYHFKFPDRKLSPWINRACHALAIDDERRTFHPLMFDEAAPRDRERINQVWFPGVHSNVGGGYPKQGMAHVSLNWMIKMAEKHGLRFSDIKKQEFTAAENVHDKMYDSRSGFKVYYRYAPRTVEKLCADNGVDPVRVHVSAFRRIVARTGDYAPGNLGPFEPVVDDAGNIGETPAHQAELLRLCNHGWTHNQGLYEQPRLVKYRRLLHAGFALATLLIFVIGGVVGAFSDSGSGEPNSLMTAAKYVSSFVPFVGTALYETILAPLFSNFLLGLIIVLIPIYLYALDILLKNELERRYQGFWRETLPAPWW